MRTTCSGQRAQGDPRGELIALDDAARRAPSHERATWRRRRETLIAAHPDLAPPVVEGIEVGWHLGFVREVRIRTIDEVAAVFAHPASRFVSAITLASSWPGLTPHQVTTLLGIAPSTVRQLAFGDPGEVAPSHGEVIDLDEAFARSFVRCGCGTPG